MKAHKERREQLIEKEEKQHTKNEEKKGTNSNSVGENVLDPVANKSLFENSIMSEGTQEKGNFDEVAQNYEDLLVFSRSVHKIDSSLE